MFTGEIARRRKEIGIRLGLGARGWGVVLLFVRQALHRATIGTVAGTILGALMTRGMASLLFGVQAFDVTSFAVVIAIVILVAVIATLIPAIQGLRHTPIASLREG